MNNLQESIAKRIPLIFLRTVVVLIGVGVLVFMLWEPHLEGRNAHATLFQIYFNDPFLAYAYTASIAFFTAIYQTFRLIGYIGKNKAFSPNSVRSLRTIKYCAMAIIGFVAAPVVYLFIVRPGDDIAGGVAVGLFLIFVSVVAASVASVLERILQSVVAIKNEDDLTV